jgi:hypothetical protein
MVWGIIEPLTAGIIVSLINKYIIGRNIFESCMAGQEEYNDSVSITTTVSDASSTQHVHM